MYLVYSPIRPVLKRTLLKLSSVSTKNYISGEHNLGRVSDRLVHVSLLAYCSATGPNGFAYVHITEDESLVLGKLWDRDILPTNTSALVPVSTGEYRDR